MEAFQIPRRKVSLYFGIARSTLYRWLHKIEDQKPSSTPTNKTPAEVASLVWEITKANAGWIIEALKCAIQKHGTPKPIISDQASVFVGDAFAELLRQ